MSRYPDKARAPLAPPGSAPPYAKNRILEEKGKPMGLALLGPLAVLNLRRHALRTWANVISIVLAVGAMIFFLSFFRGSYEGSMFSSVIDLSTAHIQLQSASFDEDDPDGWLSPASLFNAEPWAGQRPGVLPELEGVVAGSARLISPAFAGDGARKASVLLAGVNYSAEGETFILWKRMKSGSFGPGGAVIGASLAKSLGIEEGDEIRIQASSADGSPNLDYWTVTGIFSAGYSPLDRGLVFIPLADAQEFLGAPAMVNKVYLRSASREKAGRLMPRINEAVSGSGLKARFWEEYATAIVEDAKSDTAFFSVFIVILLFLSYSTVAGTMKTAIYERRREIGMLRSSGWLRKEIGRLFLLEAAAIGILGSLIGAGVGGIASLAFKVRPIDLSAAMESLDIPSFVMTCAPKAQDFLWSVLAGILAALAAGTAPAIRAAKIDILKAISGR